MHVLDRPEVELLLLPLLLHDVVVVVEVQLDSLERGRSHLLIVNWFLLRLALLVFATTGNGSILGRDRRKS